MRWKPLRSFRRLAQIAIGIVFVVSGAASAFAADSGPSVSILAYHRFGPVAADSMTTTNAVFEKQLAWLREHRYRIIPLRTVVDAIRGTASSDIDQAVAITVDDGHRTVYTDLFPLIQRYRFPVTLFIYPSAISNASYAMTWEQIEEMARTGLVDVQSHTFWHPNFKREKARLAPAQYVAFVRTQFLRSRAILEAHVKHRVDMLAWPFGIYDDELERLAMESGYIAAFSIDRRPAMLKADPLSLPRYLMTDYDRGARFGAIVSGNAR